MICANFKLKYMRKLKLSTLILGAVIFGSSCEKSEEEENSYELNLKFDYSLDDSGTINNDFTTYGTISYEEDRNGNSNLAASFDGSSYLRVTNEEDHIDLSAYTVAAWLKPASNSWNQYAFGLTSPNRDISLAFNNSKFNGHFHTNGKYYSVENPNKSEIGTWTHVAYVYTTTFSGSTATLYVDGIEVKTNDFDAIPKWTGLIMNIGSMNNTYNFIGAIDDMIFTHRALSANEIRDLAEY